MFGRSVLIGLLATIVDLGILTFSVEALALMPTVANVPALILGASVQFIGCRLFVFRSRGRLQPQIAGFIAAEAGTLTLNAILFHFVITLTPVPYAVARSLSSFLVFALFSFPAWKHVFRDDAI